MIEIKKNTHQVDSENIKKIESSINQTLPMEYKNFLLKFNGGVPEKNIVKSKYNNGIEFRVKEFFGIGVNEDLMLNIEVYSDRLPNECIPIASIEGGNLLCLDLSEERYGYIYFWDHETVSDKNTSILELDKISKSFGEFLDKAMQKSEIDNKALEGYEVVKGWVNPEFLKKINKQQDN